jgi:hypothetical protein
MKKVSQNFLVSAHSVKEAYERIAESLSTLMVDFMVPSIILSPIVDIFPFNEELDVELSRRPLDEDEVASPGKGVVYSASGSDVEDEDDEGKEGSGFTIKQTEG